MKKAIKFEIIRDDENNVSAYKLGNWYLCKIYGWGNVVNWYILDHHAIHLYEYEKSKMGYVGDGYKMGYVLNCAQGKKVLTERFLQEAL